MRNIRQEVIKNALELVSLLDTIKSKMEAVTGLYTLLDGADDNSMEVVELRRLIALCEGRFVDDTHSMTSQVQRLTMARTEGKLALGNDGRYRLRGKNHVFTCGAAIEVYLDSPQNDDQGWKFGRVEHKADIGYYFKGYGCFEDYPLKSGMKAAIRG